MKNEEVEMVASYLFVAIFAGLFLVLVGRYVWSRFRQKPVWLQALVGSLLLIAIVLITVYWDEISVWWEWNMR